MLPKEGCHRDGCAVEEGMLLRVERREKEAVRVGRWEVEILLRILLYFQ